MILEKYIGQFFEGSFCLQYTRVCFFRKEGLRKFTHPFIFLEGTFVHFSLPLYTERNIKLAIIPSSSFPSNSAPCLAMPG
jgi:hypothetical protein